MRQQVLDCFVKLFGGEGDIRTYFAPGRVNLIGEHTDYNGGHVFPCALTIGTYMAVRKRADRKVNFYSMNFEDLKFEKYTTADKLNKAILKNIKDENKYFIFLDEIQHVRNFEKVLASLKATQNVSIFVTGSNSKLLFVLKLI